jgi:hypothetical protein
MDDVAFRRWLDDYVEAWETYDPDAIGELFSADAVYRYYPWDSDPLEGRGAIVASWLADRDDPDSWTASYEPWLVSGDQAVAIGTSRYLGPDRESVEREYHNVFLCRFDSDGRCREFTELYLRRDD